jgi:hypothetical protein
VLEQELAKSKLPAMIIWGREDEVFDAATFADRFKRLLPHAEGPHLVTGKHFLHEDCVGHYPEFRTYFVRIFDLDRVGLAEPGFVQAPSGLIYALVFIGRSGEPFPSGVEVYAVVDALEPIDDRILDTDLWAILSWMIEGVGAPWTKQDLEETGRLYRIPAARASSVR